MIETKEKIKTNLKNLLVDFFPKKNFYKVFVFQPAEDKWENPEEKGVLLLVKKNPAGENIIQEIIFLDGEFMQRGTSIHKQEALEGIFRTMKAMSQKYETLSFDKITKEKQYDKIINSFFELVKINTTQKNKNKQHLPD
ncbi:MAG: hypothetical protein ABIH20_04420 [Candidatus Diapherotrites archaeon]